jgi:hypothetical protein
LSLKWFQRELTGLWLFAPVAGVGLIYLLIDEYGLETVQAYMTHVSDFTAITEMLI